VKLRSQLALLVGGIVVVPFVVAASVLVLQYFNLRTSARDPERMLPGDWIRRGTAVERLEELRVLAAAAARAWRWWCSGPTTSSSSPRSAVSAAAPWTRTRCCGTCTRTRRPR
jgi:hypothetical protein